MLSSIGEEIVATIFVAILGFILIKVFSFESHSTDIVKE